MTVSTTNSCDAEARTMSPIMIVRSETMAGLIGFSGWLLDSSDLHGRWFGHGERFHGGRTLSHGLWHEPVEKLSPVLREATVESERELVEIRLQMRRRDGTLVGAAQPAFEQGDHQRNRVEFLTRWLAPGGDDVVSVIETPTTETLVNRESVGHDPCAWLHIVPMNHS